MSYFSSSRKDNSFIASIQRYGLSRPNRYDILISNPATQRGLGAFSSESLTGTVPSSSNLLDAREGNDLVAIRCESIQLPGKATRSVAEENIYGPQYEVPQGITYSNQISASFLLDRNMHVKRYFDGWMERIQDTKTLDMNFYENYVRDMVIRQLNEQDVPVYACLVSEVYPSSVEAVALSNATRSDVSRLDVTFAFRLWRETVKDLDNGFDPKPMDMENQLEDKIGFKLELDDKDKRARRDKMNASILPSNNDFTKPSNNKPQSESIRATQPVNTSRENRTYTYKNGMLSNNDYKKALANGDYDAIARQQTPQQRRENEEAANRLFDQARRRRTEERLNRFD